MLGGLWKACPFFVWWSIQDHHFPCADNKNARKKSLQPNLPWKKSIMNRSELEVYITEIYSTEGKHLFDQYPSVLVFRHSENREVVYRHYGHPQKESETSCRG